ncbi:MAG TPA: tetratricopeptide repeat protein [Polyangiaceae bacterium]|jgi:hypothetical protein|nr:tetratricopeptide repeat protein [Polyangiaceae bacterium]
MKGTSARALAAVVGLSAALLATPAGAQTGSDPVAARALFQDGRKLAGLGKFDEACPKFERSLSLDAGIGTMFNLADCYEHIGRTASAWSKFLDATSAAQAAGEAEREKVARQRATALEPHLSRLTVTVAAPPPSLEVHDGPRAVPPSLYGEAVPVDPGEHTLEATAPGKKPWSATVHVGKDGDAATVTVPALEDVEAAPAPVAQAPMPGPIPPEPAPARPSWPTAAGWISAGAGVVGVGVGVAFGLLTESKNSDAKSVCPTSMNCTPSDVTHYASDQSDAKTDRTIAIVGFAAGGAALVAGAALLLTAPRSHEAAMQIVPLVAPGRMGASMAARF